MSFEVRSIFLARGSMREADCTKHLLIEKGMCVLVIKFGNVNGGIDKAVEPLTWNSEALQGLQDKGEDGSMRSHCWQGVEES